jgi:mannitol/fructose-specific phosphotransferase system IIA component
VTPEQAAVEAYKTHLLSSGRVSDGYLKVLLERAKKANT